MRLGLLVFACVLVAQALAWSDEPPPPPPGSETVTITRAQWDATQAAIQSLTQAVTELKAQRAAPATGAPPPPSTEVTPAETPSTGVPPPPVIPGETPGPSTNAGQPAPTAPAGGGGKALSLPDISFVAQAKLKLSSDKRDEMRDRLRLTEAEIGIQGYVYPHVKADAFVTMSPSEGAFAQVEEAYLTYISLRPGMNLYVGRKHVPFDRTNQLHNHSWLYVQQPLVLRTLVADESLTGDGLDISYVLPTPKNYFAQIDLGGWTGDGAGDATKAPDILVGPGAGFGDRFYTTRLWLSHAPDPKSEIELGGSYALGRTPGFGPAVTTDGNIGRESLSGVDLTYRHFGQGTQRLLLRAEGVWRHEDVKGADSTAGGYYVFANYRKDKYGSWGALWDWCQFPQAPDLHELALSLIYTRQLSEQYYLRLQATHGSRPGDSAYNELWLQWVWSVGPHTHNLE